MERLLSRYRIAVEWLAECAPITSSFWGEPEAGIVGQRVFARPDTPVHSLLHEVCHIICMTPERRDALSGNAGSDDLEESAVCYLQLILADLLPATVDAGHGRLGIQFQKRHDTALVRRRCCRRS